MVGDVVRRTIDNDPSLCAGSGNSTSGEFEYSDCPASLDIAVTMAFIYALFMVSA